MKNRIYDVLLPHTLAVTMCLKLMNYVLINKLKLTILCANSWNRSTGLILHACASDKEKERNEKKRVISSEEQDFAKEKVGHAMDQGEYNRWLFDSQWKQVEHIKTF